MLKFLIPTVLLVYDNGFTNWSLQSRRDCRLRVFKKIVFRTLSVFKKRKKKS
jgi:hypothetical protein